MKRLLRSAMLVLCLLVPGSAALGQPYPSLPADSTIVPGPPPDFLYWSRVAFGTNVGLVTWVAGEQLFGARVSRTGQLIDTLPIEIGDTLPGSNINMLPGLAWGGGCSLTGEKRDSHHISTFVKAGLNPTSIGSRTLPHSIGVKPRATGVVRSGERAGAGT